MTVTMRSVYVLRCDDPTCDSMYPQGNDLVYDDNEHLLQGAESAGWQVHELFGGDTPCLVREEEPLSSFQ